MRGDCRVGVVLKLVAIVAGRCASRKVGNIRPPAIAVALENSQILGHRNSSIPLARRIDDSVPVATCLPGAPGTVMTLGLSGWTYWR